VAVELDPEAEPEARPAAKALVQMLRRVMVVARVRWLGFAFVCLNIIKS
jgi:hypothetical protein